jgi:hypothetical protein
MYSHTCLPTFFGEHVVFIFGLEDGGKTFLRNVDKRLLYYMASHSTRE